MVASPRMPAGLLTAEAWDLLRAHPVFTAEDSEQVRALRASGVDVTVGPPDADVLLKADGDVIWLAGPTGDGDFARILGRKLLLDPGQVTLELCYGSWDPPGARLLDAVSVIDTLRNEDPWLRSYDAAHNPGQTPADLARYLLEEAQEAYEAVVSGDPRAIREELGDVLLQVLLHARLAEELPEDDRFTIDDVSGEFVDKMVRRNPHVFAGVTVNSIDDIINNWNLIKQAEKALRTQENEA